MKNFCRSKDQGIAVFGGTSRNDALVLQGGTHSLGFSWSLHSRKAKGSKKLSNASVNGSQLLPPLSTWVLGVVLPGILCKKSVVNLCLSLYAGPEDQILLG